MNLKLIEYSEEDCVLKDDLGAEVFSWETRNDVLHKWLNRCLDKERHNLFTKFMKYPCECIEDSPVSLKWKVEIANWLVEWGYDKKLSPDFERAHYGLVRRLFFWSLKHYEASEYELNYKARLYLKILFDKENTFSSYTYYNREGESYIYYDREDEVKDILYKEARTLRDFLKESKHRAKCLHILKRSAEWFLRRYDLATAGDLFQKVNNLSGKSKNTKFKRLQKLKSTITRLTSNRFLVNRSIVLLAMLIAFIFPTFGLDANWMMTAALIVSYFSIIWILVHFAIRDEPWHLRLMLPRMLGAIIVGYLPVIMTEEMWKLAYRMYENWRLLSLTAIIGLLASFMYLFVEINNITEKHTFQRTLTVWIIGLIETIGVGLILCHLVSRYFSPKLLGLEELISAVEAPLMGEMYPQVLILFAPLALFIGTFVQILWEDKPISEPL